MSQLNIDAVKSTVRDTITNNLSNKQINEILTNSGITSLEFLVKKISEEFQSCAEEEEGNSYLTKGSWRSQLFGGMLPEHVIETIVDSHLSNNFMENANMSNDTYVNYQNPSQPQGKPSYEDLQENVRVLQQRLIEQSSHSPKNWDYSITMKDVQQNNAVMEAFKHVGTTIGGQLKGAVTAEVSARINRALIGYARQAFPQLPQGPVADTVLGFAIPSVLLLIAHSVREAGPETVGISRQITDGVETTAKAALAGVSRDAISTAVDQAVPMLSFVAAMSSGNIPDQLTDGAD